MDDFFDPDSYVDDEDYVGASGDDCVVMRFHEAQEREEPPKKSAPANSVEDEPRPQPQSYCQSVELKYRDMIPCRGCQLKDMVESGTLDLDLGQVPSPDNRVDLPVPPLHDKIYDVRRDDGVWVEAVCTSYGSRNHKGIELARFLTKAHTEISMPVDQTSWRVAKAGSQYLDNTLLRTRDEHLKLEHEFPRLKRDDLIYVRPMRRSEWREGIVTGNISWYMTRGGTVEVSMREKNSYVRQVSTVRVNSYDEEEVMVGACECERFRCLAFIAGSLHDLIPPLDSDQEAEDSDAHSHQASSSPRSAPSASSSSRSAPSASSSSRSAPSTSSSSSSSSSSNSSPRAACSPRRGGFGLMSSTIQSPRRGQKRKLSSPTSPSSLDSRKERKKKEKDLCFRLKSNEQRFTCSQMIELFWCGNEAEALSFVSTVHQLKYSVDGAPFSTHWSTPQLVSKTLCSRRLGSAENAAHQASRVTYAQLYFLELVAAQRVDHVKFFLQTFSGSSEMLTSRSNKDMWTAMHIACDTLNAKMVALIAKFTKKEGDQRDFMRDKFGWTPAHVLTHAAGPCCDKSIRLCADVLAGWHSDMFNRQLFTAHSNFHGDTPLAMCIRQQNVGLLVHLVISCGGKLDPWAIGPKNHIWLCFEEGSWKCLRVILKYVNRPLCTSEDDDVHRGKLCRLVHPNDRCFSAIKDTSGASIWQYCAADPAVMRVLHDINAEIAHAELPRLEDPSSSSSDDGS